MMRPSPVNWRARMAQARVAQQLEQRAKKEGLRHGPTLMNQPVGSWRRLMRSEPELRSYGTLHYLLEQARERFETEPSAAREMTAAVLDFVDEVSGPSAVHEIALRGLAWKEHANALHCVGTDFREALVAAERAIDVFGLSAGLHFEQTKARLVAANILRDMGEYERALEVVRQCQSVFKDYAHKAYRAIARTCEGTILFALKRFREGLDVFTALVEEAELEGDKLTLARALNNGAECARELGDLRAARDLYPRALAHFEELNLPTEANRVRWGYALSLVLEGQGKRAVWELLRVQGVFLDLGMNADAAAATLDIVRIRFAANEDIRDVCSELVTIFARAGMTQNALEALAYLREQAKNGTVTLRKIARVRTFFGELPRTPNLLFARPPDEEG